MHRAIDRISKVFKFIACGAAIVVAQQATAQAPGSVQEFRGAFGALIDGYEQVFRQEGDLRGVDWTGKARAALLVVPDAELSRVFSASGFPDVSAGRTAIQRLADNSHKSLKSAQRLKSLPFPGAPSVISACNDTPHGDQITYDALIAFQVTSGILSAAAWGCNEDIAGENGSLVCAPFAIANDVASSLFAVRSFCGSLDTSMLVQGNYDRLGHLHTDLASEQTTIISNDNSNKTAIVINDNNNTKTITDNANANKNEVITVANANTAKLVSEIRALGCEIVRLLTTPEGMRASAILACAGQPSYPYSFPKK